jgi:hypothetical protein
MELKKYINSFDICQTIINLKWFGVSNYFWLIDPFFSSLQALTFVESFAIQT